MPELILEAFNSSVTMDTSGTLISTSVASIDASANAVLTVSLSDMRNMFKFQTDSVDVLNADASDLKFYVEKTSYWPTLNPANAMMDHASSSNAIATADLAANKLMIAHDFTRYLAEKLFGTYHGVDLFNNEVELLQNLRSICGSSGAMGTINDLIDNVDITNGDHANIATDGDGNKYMTNATTTSANICKALFDQLASNSPSRFSSLTDSPNKQSLPFAEDDSFTFKLTINPEANQHTLTNVDPIGARTYKIQLILKNSVSNTAVDAAEE